MMVNKLATLLEISENQITETTISVPLTHIYPWYGDDMILWLFGVTVVVWILAIVTRHRNK